MPSNTLTINSYYEGYFMMMSTINGLNPTLNLDLIKKVLSEARINTYQTALYPQGNNDRLILELYLWNSRLSGFFHPLLEVCEVTVRNAVAEVLEKKYGINWPYNASFERSLPLKSKGKSLRCSLYRARRNKAPVGKIIADLNFIFWQKMFMPRHEARLWNPYLLTTFPGLNETIAIKDHLSALHEDLGTIRLFRNRIAHYEPIFHYDCMLMLKLIMKVVSYRSKDIADRWAIEHGETHLQQLLQSKP